MHDTGRHGEGDGELRTGPGQDRIPSLRLPFRKLGRVPGAIAEQIAAGIFHDIGSDLDLASGDAVEPRVDQPGQRHRARIDALGLRAPFLRQRFGKALRRHGNDRLGRRADRPAVEVNGVGEFSLPLDGRNGLAFLGGRLRNRDLLVKSLGERGRARATALDLQGAVHPIRRAVVALGHFACPPSMSRSASAGRLSHVAATACAPARSSSAVG